MTLEELKEKNVALLGLGVNNKALARHLKSKGVVFEVFEDWKRPEELTEKILGFDVLFRTPALPYLSEPIQKAKSMGKIIYSQTKLFFDLCPSVIIGVTGTKGKGTTATLIARILEAAGKKVWLAGNIGRDPFEFIDETAPSDFVVLELSSFQLQDLHKSPHLAVVLKVTSEHLDYHKSVDEYVEAKKSIVRYQAVDDFAVLNYDGEISRALATITEAQVLWNSIEKAVDPGCYIKDGRVVLNVADTKQDIMSVEAVGLLGRFNLQNVTAAIVAAAAVGVRDSKLVEKVVREFKGLEHRLEFVAEIQGVRFYNDSFSTTPDTAIAAMEAFEGPLIMLVGGSKKGSDYSQLGHEIARCQVKALVPIGQTGQEIADFARNAGYDGRIIDKKFGTMEEIVDAASELADSGDVVLLSPASASFDMFSNYKHRGELFKKFVKRLIRSEA